MLKYCLLICIAGLFLSGCATTDNRYFSDTKPWYSDMDPSDEDSDWAIIDLSPTTVNEGKETVKDLRYDVTEIFQ